MIDSVQELLIALNSSNQSTQDEAIIQFVAKREQLGPALINTMLSTDYETVREQVIASIGKLNEHMISVLVEYIERSLVKSRTRKEMVEFSVAVGDPAFKAITYIIQKHERSSGFAFDTLVGAKLPAVPHLINLSKDRDLIISVRAVNSLTRIGELAASAIPTLKQILANSNNYGLRLALGKAFGTFGEKGLNELTEMSASHSIDVRRAAIYGLPETGSEGIIKILLEGINDPAWQVRLAATQKLYGIGWRTRRPDIMQWLQQLKNDPHWRIRREAIYAVKWLVD